MQTTTNTAALTAADVFGTECTAAEMDAYLATLATIRPAVPLTVADVKPGQTVRVIDRGICTVVRCYTTGRAQNGVDVRDANGCMFWVPMAQVKLDAEQAAEDAANDEGNRRAERAAESDVFDLACHDGLFTEQAAEPWVVVAWDAGWEDGGVGYMATAQQVTMPMDQESAEYAENVRSIGLRKRAMPLSLAVALGIE